MLLGLALVYIYVSGPFWSMINSDIHYLDQYSFIQPLYFFLKEMIEHPDLLLADTDSVPAEIESFRLRSPRTPTTDKVLQFRQVALATDQDLLLHVMKVLAKHFVDVMDRQLADFLPFGKYGSAPMDESRQRMQHCQLTNLLGETCFADLDYSMFKNRAATLHHHSTLNMGKRNRPVSSWLSKKSADEQSRLLSQARKGGPQMRQAPKQKQLAVLEEIQESLAEQRREKRAREQKQMQVKRNLADEIHTQGGACKSCNDVENLLERCTSKKEKLQALKNQTRYYRLFYDAKRLPLSNISVQQLSTNLSTYLKDNFSEQDTGQEDQTHEEEDDIQEDNNSVDPPAPFQFTTQGQTVAVCCDERFYIGEVLLPIRPNLAEVTFMEQRGVENTFKWPGSDVIEEVDCKFVFYWDFTIIPKHRVWIVEDKDWVMLKRKWQQLQKPAEHAHQEVK